MRSFQRLLLPFLLGFFLVACAQFGQQKPQTPEDNLRYGQAVLTGVVKTIGDAAGTTLPATDARRYLTQLQEPRKDLDAADKVVRALPAGSPVPSDVVGKINATVSVLEIVAGELRSRLPAAQTAAIPKR